MAVSSPVQDLAYVTVRHKWQILSITCLLYVVAKIIYRRFFHPLAKVPGPFWPAVTKLYQTYHNSKYFEQVDRLHKQYGPIVRINPDEVHLSNIDYYDEIYYVGTKYTKGVNYYDSTCVPQSLFGTTNPETHRIRRAAMNPMFSRKMVLDLESVVQDKATKLCKKMSDAIVKNEPCDLHHAFRFVSIDVISDFAFNKSYNFLEREDAGKEWFEVTGGLGQSMWVFQQFPTIQEIALSIPPWLAPKLDRALGKVVEFQQECLSVVKDVQRRKKAGKLTGRPTIFSTLLTMEDKPEEYRIPPDDHLKDEAYSQLMAAADTTGNAMTVAVFHTLANPTVYKKICDELARKFPDSDEELPFMELEKISYLTAIIKEGLRLSFGVPGRLPRHVPKPGAEFEGYFIPPGYLVGMSSWTLHRNSKVFPDPMKFDPERWMNPETFRELDRNIVPFSRGTRQCIGMPLAQCELYVTLGTFFRRFPNLKVYNTTSYDMEYIDNVSSYHLRGRNLFKAVAATSEKSA